MFENRSYISSTKDALLDQLCDSLDQQFGGGAEAAFSQYQEDPVGFGENVLGESYTEDVRRMMESVRDGTTRSQSLNRPMPPEKPMGLPGLQYGFTRPSPTPRYTQLPHRRNPT